MNIKYKLIEHERIGDAPFTGALISACDCEFNCTNCFNQKIKKLPTQENTAENIIKEVRDNLFNRGIILAGLEWTLQDDEAVELCSYAKSNGLSTMIYTGIDFNDEKIKQLLSTNIFDYIKCGRYEESLKSHNHIEHGITLASSNQHIYKKDIDY